jgi:hypothetical protein
VGNKLWGGSDLHERRLNVSPAGVGGGPKVTVSWNGVANPATQDWIGLCHPGDANTSYIDSRNASLCAGNNRPGCSRGQIIRAMRPKTTFGQLSARAYRCHNDRAARVSIENPYTGCGITRVKQGIPCLYRSHHHPGMVTAQVIQAFASIGWGWGGTKHYMHFSANGHSRAGTPRPPS